MATSSFFHSVVINTPEQAEKLVDALEKAEKFSRENPQPKVNCHWVRKDEVADFVKKIKWQAI